MSSLLTNNSAMVALQTMKNINKSMTEVQGQISTGKRIASARDNAALWGISTTMQTDVSGFKAISESLSLGSATLSVGRDAAETITSLLDQMKGKIVAAQEENVDRAKIQADVDALRDQIRSVRGAAQFNGLNLIDNGDTVNVLSSLDRDSTGFVASSSISFSGQNLSESKHVFDSVGTSLDANIGIGATGTDTATTQAAGRVSTVDLSSLADEGATDAGDTFVISLGDTRISIQADGSTSQDDASEIAALVVSAINAANVEGISAGVNASSSDRIDITNTNEFSDIKFSIDHTPDSGTTENDIAEVTIGAKADNVLFDKGATVKENDGYRVAIVDGSSQTHLFDYVARAGDTFSDIAAGLKAAIDGANLDGVTTNLAKDADDNVLLQIDTGDTAMSLQTLGNYSENNVQGGGLFPLADIDVTTKEGAQKALANIEFLIQNSIDAAAEFGSSQGRIDTQLSFVGKIMDGLTSGIGALVDADMEAASARLQALQVQQQLGIQALSIANQQPQNILALFR